MEILLEIRVGVVTDENDFGVRVELFGDGEEFVGRWEVVELIDDEQFGLMTFWELLLEDALYLFLLEIFLEL